jgi:hypothetical protein
VKGWFIVKKLIALVAMVALVIGVVGCSSQTTKPAGGGTTPPSSK